MLMMALAPPITALIGWIILGEHLTPMNWLGMAITIAGIALVVLRREEKDVTSRAIRKVKFNFPIWGVLLGLGGALGQAAGLVLSKYGMKDYDPFAASQIRVLTGIAGFSILFTILGRWKNALQSLSLRKPMIQLSVGAFFGPFLGVSFSLLSVQLTTAGIAATIMAIVPVLIIAPSVIINKEKVTFREIAGAIIAVGGVSLFFI